MKDKIEAMISYVFGKYDMRKGKTNQMRMSKLLDFCMDDINEHPSLIDELQDNTTLEHFIIQSIIYMTNDKENANSIHKKDAILYEGILTPQQYLEMMTGKYFCLDADNQFEAVENILDGEFGEGAYWSFALDSIDEVMESSHKVILVEIVNIIIHNDKAEQEKLYRWFEVPDDWTKELVEKKLAEI